jgi:hypothetical protein
MVLTLAIALYNASTGLRGHVTGKEVHHAGGYELFPFHTRVFSLKGRNNASRHP